MLEGRPEGSLRTRIALRAMALEAERDRGTKHFDIRERLEERGLKSAIIGLAQQAIISSRIPLGTIAERLTISDQEIVGIGYSSVVLRGEQEGTVEKYTPIGDGNVDELWDSLIADNEVGQEVFGDMHVPVSIGIDLESKGGLKGPFIVQTQEIVDGADIFKVLQQGEPDDDLKLQIAEFLGGYYVALDKFGRAVDVRGSGNVVVDESQNIRILDTGFHSVVDGEPGFIRHGIDQQRQQDRILLLHSAIE